MEIERRFLVDIGKFHDPLGTPYLINQYYIKNTSDPLVRIRRKNDRYYLTFKGKGLIKRSEVEFEINEFYANELIYNFPTFSLEKERYEVNYDGMTWEIDFFLGSLHGLIIAEVELQNEDQKISIPPWVEKEITEDGRWTNIKLAMFGKPE